MIVKMCLLFFSKRPPSPSWKTMDFLYRSLFCMLIVLGETREHRSGYLDYVYQNPFRHNVFPYFSNLTGFGSDFHVILLLFNRKHPNGIIITPEGRAENFTKLFVPNTGIKFVTHGWNADEKSTGVAGIRSAYLHNEEDMNVVEIGWGSMSKNEYTVTTMLLYRVAEYTGTTILKILDAGVSELNKIHVIGHSLGAHVAGLIGGFILSAGRGLVARVTGLDPAKPLFELIRGEDSRLDQDDGEFVDVIHSCIGLSYAENLGHADFYPNGGYCTQPGCVNLMNPISTAACAHSKAYYWYISSIYQKNAYPAVKCDSFMTYELGKCEDNEQAFMGAYTSSSTRGSYYLTTNSTTPDEGENMNTSKLINQ